MGHGRIFFLSALYHRKSFYSCNYIAVITLSAFSEIILINAYNGNDYSVL